MTLHFPKMKENKWYKKWLKDITLFVKQNGILEYCRTKEINGKQEVVYRAYYKMGTFTQEELERIFFEFAGLSYSILEKVFSTPKEELEQMSKLARLNALKKQVEELEKEIK